MVMGHLRGDRSSLKADGARTREGGVDTGRVLLGSYTCGYGRSMRQRGVLLVLWIASLVAALFLGFSLRPSPPVRVARRPDMQTLELRREVADLEWKLAELRARRETRAERDDASRPEQRSQPERPRRGERRRARDAASVADPEQKHLKRLATDLLAITLADGHGSSTTLRELWATELKFHREEFAAYAVPQEVREAFALGELLLRVGARDPALVDGLDPTRVAAFLDALVNTVRVRDPGARARWAELVEAIPATLASLSAAARNKIRSWRPSPQEEQAVVGRLRDEQLEPYAAVRLLVRLTPSTARSLDVEGLVKPLVASGNYSVFRALRHAETGDAVASGLDPTFLSALEAGKYGPGAVWRYLLVTGRHDWRAARAFAETGLRLKGKAGMTFAYALTLLADPPPREFTLWAMEHPGFSEEVRTQLRRHFSAN